MMSDQWITYSFQPNSAITGRILRMSMTSGELRYLGLQFNYLAKRWNGANYQGNVYLYGGIGQVRMDSHKGSASVGGLEADIEDRKYFALFKAEFLESSLSDDLSHIEGRLGIAPYEAKYEELASWFMVQGQWHPTLVKKLILTPLVRLFYKSFLFESGVSLDGDWMMNFMFHF